ncbi:unnamed protein product [Vitrella brassicaformis CCMP3155]|uniref:Ribosomal RNA-processing protein 8 n=2 Tax=Vitrella brassicaformis TaxID=1169539 RepID=A0A0G4FXF7_VITBC|nr:unnamed protein product [Vitrella brassicaformis CCMP3155]|eukprot:CEM19952.1 unnamed protein product [Vitrella brassicaformis CCMP3155]
MLNFRRGRGRGAAAAGGRSHKDHESKGNPLSSFQRQAQERLKGGRFRHLNEKLYTDSSAESFMAFQQDPSLFDKYHDGYRRQVLQWPINPLDKMMEYVRKLPAHYTVGDFGCGEAKIAQTFPDRSIHSFDLVAANPHITACNIAHVPLADGSLDVAIFCLSLMGSDWPSFIREAYRCLKDKGVLRIAEVLSRFQDVDKFVESIETIGFRCTHREVLNSFFILLAFRKASTDRRLPQHSAKGQQSATKSKKKRKQHQQQRSESTDGHEDKRLRIMQRLIGKKRSVPDDVAAAGESAAERGSSRVSKKRKVVGVSESQGVDASLLGHCKYKKR